jgi:dolichol-phosphate mannosyltransferase
MKKGFHKNTPLNRYVGIRYILAPVLSFASGFYFSDPTPSFKAITRRFLIDKRVLPFGNELVRFNLLPYLNYLAPRLGFKVKEIPIVRVYPDYEPVPTKIHGMSVLINVFEMFKVALACHNPRTGIVNKKTL